MTNLITRGYGSKKDYLITRGYGTQIAVVIKSYDNDTVRGASTYNEYHKRRVKGINITSQDNTVILQTLVAKSEIPLKVFQTLKLTSGEKTSVLKKLKQKSDSKTKLRVIIIEKSSDKTVIKTSHILKTEQKSNFNGERLMNFVEKQIKIKNPGTRKHEDQTKHINVTDTLDTLEVTDLLDIIKDLEYDES